MSKKYLTEEIILILKLENKLNDKISWLQLAKSYKITREVYEKIKNNLSIDDLIASQEINNDFINNFSDLLKYDDICHIVKYRKLSMNVINYIKEKYIKHSNNKILKLLIINQKLDDEFIAKNYKLIIGNKENIYNMCVSQDLSMENIKKYYKSFNNDCLIAICMMQNIGEEFIKEHFNDFPKSCLLTLVLYQDLLQEFIKNKKIDCFRNLLEK